MQKKIELVAGGLLGLLFVVFGLNFFLKFIPMPETPQPDAATAFAGAMYSSGFLAFVKVLEILGGVLVAIPKTRNFGLIVLMPIIVCILAFHVFLTKGGLLEPPVVLITVLSVFLLWSARSAIAKLLND